MTTTPIDNIRHAGDALIDAHNDYSVALCISDMIHQVEIDFNNDIVVDLTNEVNRTHDVLESERTDWHKEASVLLDEENRIHDERTRIASDTETIREESTQLATSITALKNEESELLRRRAALKSKKDVNLVSFMDAKDFSRCHCVCRRWKHALSKGYLWKSFYTRMERNFLSDKRNYLNNLIPVHGHVQITLDAQENLTKDAMFTMCNERALQHLIRVQSEREDLAQKERADREVRGFLEKQVSDLRHHVGVARVEEGEWLDQIEQTKLTKNELIRVLRDRENELDRMKAQHDAVLFGMEQERKTLQQQVSLSKELSAMAVSDPVISPNTAAAAAAASNTVGEAIAELKAQKKVLVKHLKMLRAEVEQAQTIKHTYAHKLQKLQG